MRVLLVHAQFPHTYWGFQYTLPLTGRSATIAPLGLCTVAALLPREWDLHLVDLNVEPLDDAELRRADVVLIGGMLVQAPSMQKVIARARRAGRRTVVGGPAATTAAHLFDEADVIFGGEVEGRQAELIAAIVGDAPVRVGVGERPALAEAPVPRFDLLRLDRYTTMAVQTSRGCPYACEFCDVIEIFGRTPRVKPTGHVIAELEALLQVGWRGTVFVVDDNFIGNLKEARTMVPEIARWQAEHGHPFDLFTEASVNLAKEDALLASMVEAGFTAVFVGIETPSVAALASVGKQQNLKFDLREAIDRITAAGIEVMGGFIVGFDTDDATAFAAQEKFLEDAPIPMAMIGVLTALPGTALWRRLEREGRLRRASSGDQFARPNFQPAMPEAQLLAGYAELLARIYTPESYVRRCRAVLETSPRPPSGRNVRPGGVMIALRAAWALGVRGRRRRMFWQLVAPSLLRSRSAISWAVAHAIQGEHLVRYTQEDVLPRIREALVALEIERARAAA